VEVITHYTIAGGVWTVKVKDQPQMKWHRVAGRRVVPTLL